MTRKLRLMNSCCTRDFPKAPTLLNLFCSLCLSILTSSMTPLSLLWLSCSWTLVKLDFCGKGKEDDTGKPECSKHRQTAMAKTKHTSPRKHRDLQKPQLVGAVGARSTVVGKRCSPEQLLATCLSPHSQSVTVTHFASHVILSSNLLLSR